MGSMDKFINFMKMNNNGDDDDDEYIDHDYEEEEEEYAPSPKRVSAPDEDDDRAARRTQRQPVRGNFAKKGASVSNSANMEICFCKPSTFEDATQVADALLSNRSVVLNLEGLDMALAQRIFDFATGSTYAVQGKLEAISKYVYMITPESVNISGDTLEGTGALGSKSFS